jgi:hypothetical protein
MKRGLDTFLDSSKVYVIDFNKNIYIRNVFNVAERKDIPSCLVN